MTLIIKLLILIMNIIYCFLKIFPTRKKITFISRQSNDINIDFKLLKEEIELSHNDYKVVVLTKKLEKGFLNKFKYIFHILKQMYHIATSKVVVLDSYSIPISVLKHKKSLNIIQMWHAMGAFKKFGLSISDKSEGTNTKLMKTMKMHNNYNYIFTSSDYTRKYFAEAFGYSIDKLLPYPLPRLDNLNNREYIKNIKDEIIKKYPIIKKKKNILYAPTFRIDYSNVNVKRSTDTKDILKLIDCVDFNKYNLIIKTHPLSNLRIDDKRVISDQNFKTEDMLLISDYVITDYSAIVYEAAYLEKPLFFYQYDIEQYTKNRDFYLDIKKDLPGLTLKEPKKIIDAIEKNKYDIKKIKEFKNKNIKKYNVSYTKDIVEFIFKI